jgi:hypothetical protein
VRVEARFGREGRFGCCRARARRPAKWMWPESDVLWGSAVDSEKGTLEHEAHRKSSFSTGVHGARRAQSRAMRALGGGRWALRWADRSASRVPDVSYPFLPRWISACTVSEPASVSGPVSVSGPSTTRMRWRMARLDWRWAVRGTQQLGPLLASTVRATIWSSGFAGQRPMSWG